MFKSRNAVRILELTDLPTAESTAQGVELISLCGVTLLLYEINPHRGEEPRERPSYAVVDLGHCASIATGPNDEAFQNHPLYGYGMEFYAIQEVVNSPWIEERSKVMNKDRDPTYLREYRHFVFAFKEGMVECLSRSYRLAGTYPTYEDALRAAVGLAQAGRR